MLSLSDSLDPISASLAISSGLDLFPMAIKWYSSSGRQGGSVGVNRVGTAVETVYIQTIFFLRSRAFCNRKKEESRFTKHQRHAHHGGVMEDGCGTAVSRVLERNVG